MIDEMIADMEGSFRKGIFTEETCFRFVVDDATITITIDADRYSVEKGATAGTPDCTCKTSAEMFGKIWYDGYVPGIMDFIGGEIQTDAPLMLPRFLKAFGK